MERPHTPTWLLVAPAAALTLVVYAPYLRNGFVWLDHLEIVDGEHIASDVSSLLTLWTGSPYYRPLYNAAHSLDFKIWGLSPFGFHLSSLALHVVAITLAVGLARAIGWGRLASATMGLLWAVHPVNVEVVGLIHAKADLLAGVFILGTVTASLQAVRRQRWRTWMALAFLLYVLALMSKEAAFALVPLAIVSALFSPADKASRSRLFAVGIASVALGVLIARLPTRTGGISVDLDLWERTRTFAGVYNEYARKLILFESPSIADTVLRANAWSSTEKMATYGTCVSILLVEVALWRTIRSARPWLLAYNVMLVPVCQLIPILHFRADRFLYLPSLAFTGLLIVLVRALWRRLRIETGMAARCVLVATIATIALYCAYRDRSRLASFGDDISLFAPEIQRTPHYREGLAMLAAAYERRGQWASASALYRRSLTRDATIVSFLPPATVLRYSALLLAIGQPREVLVLADEWLAQLPKSHLSLELTYNRGIAFYKLGRFEEAIRSLAPYCATFSADADCLFLLGMSAYGAGARRMARESLEQYLRLVPRAPDLPFVLRILNTLEP